MHDAVWPEAKILIVDDEEANILFLERLLRKNGYQNVKSTQDPSDVMALMEWKPDLLLLDLQMPKVDGFEVMEQLRPFTSANDGLYFPILVLTADVTRKARERSLSMGAKDFLTKPLERVEVLLRINNLLETRALHLQLRDENATLDMRVKERTSQLWDSVMRLEQADKELRNSRAETVHRLGRAAEYRDDDTGAHITRMSRFSALLARGAGMPEAELEQFRLAVVMHDIGKIGIPDRILQKPRRLTAEEFELMKRHTVIGHDILDGSEAPLLQQAAVIALSHHERFDGDGYPHGLRGDEIPVDARIAAIADVFDALTSDRVYRPSFGLMKAIQTIKEDEGHFDPVLLDVFLDSMDEVIQIMEADRLDGEAASA